MMIFSKVQAYSTPALKSLHEYLSAMAWTARLTIGTMNGPDSQSSAPDLAVGDISDSIGEVPLGALRTF
jgi:hypothetical protein